MRLFFIQIYLLGCIHCISAQTKFAYVNLSYNSFDAEKIPFQFEAVELQLNNQDTVGFVNSNSNKSLYPLILKNDYGNLMLNYLNQRFEGNKKFPKIILRIKKLRIMPLVQNNFSGKDTFQFECHFIYKDRKEDTLFVFRAKNDFGLFNEPEKIMENYISRALISAVHQFTKAYIKNPDWVHKDITPSFKVKVKLQHNTMKEGDTLACEKGVKIKEADFVLKKDNDTNRKEVHSKLMLSYKVESEETSKGIELKIYTKAFFVKSRSWKKQTITDPSWLQKQQSYFDLCTEYGYRLKDAMLKAEYSVGEYRGDLNKIYNSINQEFIQAVQKMKEKNND